MLAIRRFLPPPIRELHMDCVFSPSFFFFNSLSLLGNPHSPCLSPSSSISLPARAEACRRGAWAMAAGGRQQWPSGQPPCMWWEATSWVAASREAAAGGGSGHLVWETAAAATGSGHSGRRLGHEAEGGGSGHLADDGGGDDGGRS